MWLVVVDWRNDEEREEDARAKDERKAIDDTREYPVREVMVDKVNMVRKKQMQINLQCEANLWKVDA